MSDYSRPKSQEEIKLEQKQDSLTRIIRKTPLKKLTVGDLIDIVEVFRGTTYEHMNFYQTDVEILERILKRIR